MSKKLLIKNGFIVCPAQKIGEKLDLLIIDGKIVSLQKEINDQEAEIIDAKSLIVTPGLIDMHCHLREPGREDIETIQSGAESAVAGGYTSIVCMANTNPVIDDKMGVEYILSKGKELGLLRIYPVSTVTKKQGGEELTEIASVINAGAVAISDDEKTIMNPALMRRAFEYITMLNIPLISHCEDHYLSENGCINEGFISTAMGFKGIPSIAEEIMVSRDIILARFTNSRLHIAHVSTKESVEIIRQAKKNGINVSCEVTPHHFSLTEIDIFTSNYNTNFKVSPPLRSKADLEAIWAGLADGTIDAIATDHSPWLDTEKDVEFVQAPYGIIGFETSVPLIFSKLIKTNILSLQEVIAKLTINPAKILNLDSGSLSVGKMADVTIIDPELEVLVEDNFFRSTSKNSPFIGQKLNGIAKYTIVNGQIIFDRGKSAFYKRNF